MVANDGFAPAPVPAPRSVIVAAVGDVSLARGMVPLLASEGADYPFRLVADALRADVTFANLEGVLTDHGTAWPKGYTFRSPPALASGLRTAGFSVVTLANNHSFDFGVDGLTDSIATLDSLRVVHAGAGNSLELARAPAIVEAHGLREDDIGRVMKGELSRYLRRAT